MATHLENFEFYGGDPATGRPPAWHVNLRTETVDELGETAVAVRGPYNMAQAEALGWPLPKVLAEINAQTLKDCEAARAEIAALTAERDALAAERDELKARVAELERKA